MLFKPLFAPPRATLSLLFQWSACRTLPTASFAARFFSTQAGNIASAGGSSDEALPSEHTLAPRGEPADALMKELSEKKHSMLELLDFVRENDASIKTFHMLEILSQGQIALNKLEHSMPVGSQEEAATPEMVRGRNAAFEVYAKVRKRFTELTPFFAAGEMVDAVHRLGIVAQRGFGALNEGEMQRFERHLIREQTQLSRQQLADALASFAMHGVTPELLLERLEEFT